MFGSYFRTLAVILVSDFCLSVCSIVPHGSWYDYVRAWEDVRSQLPAERLYVGYYENMQRDPVRETRHLAEFLGTGTSASLCEQIAEACSFRNMKEAAKHKKANGGANIWKPNAAGIFRKGEDGHPAECVYLSLVPVPDERVRIRVFMNKVLLSRYMITRKFVLRCTGGKEEKNKQ